jgi:hypothetical protein
LIQDGPAPLRERPVEQVKVREGEIVDRVQTRIVGAGPESRVVWAVNGCAVHEEVEKGRPRTHLDLAMKVEQRWSRPGLGHGPTAAEDGDVLLGDNASACHEVSAERCDGDGVLLTKST